MLVEFPLVTTRTPLCLGLLLTLLLTSGGLGVRSPAPMSRRPGDARCGRPPARRPVPETSRCVTACLLAGVRRRAWRRSRPYRRARRAPPPGMAAAADDGRSIAACVPGPPPQRYGTPAW